MDDNEDNKINYDQIENLIDLSDIDEDNVLQVLRSRYEKELIYTFIGNILISINPYRLFDIYGINEAKKYENQVLGTLPPHLFAIGNAAFSKLVKDHENQLFIVNGQSGSGKTESIKLILQYLAAVNKSPSNIVTEQILESNPLLETFGNSKTLKNNNSSRFGKYLEIYFKNDLIIGANIKHYLLEKPRIVSQLPDERNFHVFYEILDGFTDFEKEKYGLQSKEKYFYLNQGSLDPVEGKNDAKDFSSLLSSFQVLGFTNEQQDVIFRILASVLHLGNIYFHRKFLKTCQEGVEVGSDVEIRWSCHLLQLNMEAILQSLTYRITETREGDKLFTPYNIDQALDSRDSIAKTLYDGLFTWLLIKLNEKTNGNLEQHKSQVIKTISLLDFFGFENLNENSFEQLVINYGNEKLHQHFLQFVFKLEQQEYAKEKIDCEPIEFDDNIQVINLLVKKPIGIFSLLDDECHFPKSTDQSFLDKCHYNHVLNELYARPRMSFDFGVRHFAGVVWYSADGFLDKNRDTLKNDVIDLLVSSKMPMVSKMFTQYRQSIELARQNTLNLSKHSSSFKNTAGTSSSSNKYDLSRFTQMKPRTPTVSARFQESLSQLYQKILSINNTYYICCLTPNEDKKALQFDDQLVLEQMKNLNLVSIIRARKAGYPVKKRFCEFVSRYRCLVRQQIDRNKTFKEICELLLEYMNVDHNLFKLGISKVFLKEKLENSLEIKREKLLLNAVIVIQSYVRGYLERSKLRKMKSSVIRIQSAYRGYRECRTYMRKRKAIIRLQSTWRMIKQRREFKNMQIVLKKRRDEDAKREERERLEREARNESLSCLSSSIELDIPEQLERMLLNLNNLNLNRSERNIHKLTTEQQSNFKFCRNQLKQLPSDIDQFAFSKFTNIYFNSHVWAMKKEPIKTSFLLKNSNFEVKQSLTLFKLVLKFMNDPTLTDLREKIFLDFIINSAIKHDYLRDELLSQLSNQTWKNENQINVNRGWLLMINCLSCFSPSTNLFKYLLKYLSDNSSSEYRALLQQKLLNSEGQTRKYPPTYLEWIANSRKANLAFNFSYPNNERAHCEVNSFSTGESIATDLLSCKGINELNSFGWSVDLEQEDQLHELNGEDFLFDLINEIENPLISNYEDDFYIFNQFENGNEDLLEIVNDISAEHDLNGHYMNGHQDEMLHNLSLDHHLSSKNESNIQRHHSLGSLINEQVVLSKNSKLNKRYLQEDKELESLKFSETSKLNKRYTSGANASSTSNLLSNNKTNNNLRKDDLVKVGAATGGVARKLNKQQSMQQHSMSNLVDIKNNSLSKRSMSLQELGLANSALNDRYFDKNTNKSNSLTKKDLSSLNSSIVSASSNQIVNEMKNVKPKVMSYGNLADLANQQSSRDKSQLTKSTSSYWYKEKFKNSHQFGNYLNVKSHHHHRDVPSSAMSDVSEAPSLASHVKNIKLPTHANELDAYLDSLFRPVLDSNLDELSDARSLAASIKGGGDSDDKHVYDDQLDLAYQAEQFRNEEDDSIQHIKPNQIKKLNYKEFKQLSLLNENVNLCQLIKGGESKDLKDLKEQKIVSTTYQQFSPDSSIFKGQSSINTSLNSSLTMNQTETFDISQNISSQQSNAFTNVAGMTVPIVDTSQVIQQQLVHQQMIQRAFLASAVQQNLQIQQQLLKQNQALQQLLSSDSSELNSSNQNLSYQSSLADLNSKLLNSTASGLDSSSTEEALQSIFPVPLQTLAQDLNNQTDDKRDEGFKEDASKKNDSRKMNEKIKILSSTNKQSGSSVPVPPPLPLSPLIAYGSRAKTVRIGKIRWPPSRQEGDGCESNSISSNSTNQAQAKENENDSQISKEKNDLIANSESKGNNKQEYTKLNGGTNILNMNAKEDRLIITELRSENQKNNKLNLNNSMINMSNHLIASATAVNNMNRSLSTNGLNNNQQDNNRLIANSNVGKLRISSEMKAKLEMLTINQSVRSTAKSSSSKNDLMAKSMENLQDIRENNRSVNKLSKERRSLLEKQLLGQFNSTKVNSVDNLTTGNQLNQKKTTADNFNKLVKNQNYLTRESRERNDELGIHVHHKFSKLNQNSSASLSALNYNYCYDCKKNDEGNCKFYCRERLEFDQISTSMCNMTDLNDEHLNSSKLNKFNNQLNLTNHQSKFEVLFGDNLKSGQFLDASYLKQNSHQFNDQHYNQNEDQIKMNNKLNTKLYQLNKLYLTYQKVPWELRLRKELFSPTERIDSPLVLGFIFLQIIRDAYSAKCIRMRPDEKQSIIDHLETIGVDKQNYLNQPQKLTVQKAVVQMARQMPLYFSRFYSIINCKNYPDTNQLAVSHSGLRLVKREQNEIKIIETICFEDIVEITSTKENYIQVLDKSNTTIHLISDKAQQIKSLIEYFIVESLKNDAEFVRAIADYQNTSEPTLLNFKKGDIIAIAKHKNSNLKIAKGWCYGIHKSTGESGLLSLKYVVPLNSSKSSMNQFELNEQVSEDLKSTSKTESANLKESSSQSWIENKNENLVDTRRADEMRILASNDYVKNNSLEMVSGGSEINNQTSSLTDGKFSLLQFALFNFVEAIDNHAINKFANHNSILSRQPPRYELIQEPVANQANSDSNQVKLVETLRAKKNKKKNNKNGSDKDWTWKSLSDLVKFTSIPLNQPLLKHSHNSLNKISLECFSSIMKYMGDLKLTNDQTEVDCVYNILVNCHKHLEVRDEVYCQLMKQTTNNKSVKPDSCQRGWRLFSIVTSYFDCSDNLRPYLFKYLETTAYDKRRAYHATALVCLQNFRKTLRFGGRKNVPSVEEILAITAGRNSKRQMYRLPGGTEKVISAKSSTVVNDVIEEICLQLNVHNSIEQQEFSLYCIVTGDPYTMPINRDEYILDITTELIKNGQIFYLIFCRSVWYFNLKLDSPLYIEVIFNQIAPDYLEGLLLVLSSNKLKSNQDQPENDLQNGKLSADHSDPNNIFADFTLSDQMVNDISRIASLLHRAADMEHQPTKDEVKYLLPKPILPMKFMKPAKWVELVQSNWADMSAITTMEAKAQCLDCLSKWQLFGSCFFAVKHCVEYNSTDFPEYILALNRNGSYFLDIITHETIWMYAYIDIISTRKVRSEDGTLFLDLKCGNLMQQKVTRIQTDQAHEISRLIKQYIEIQNHDKKIEPMSMKNQFIQDV